MAATAEPRQRSLFDADIQQLVDDAILPSHVNGVPWQRGSDTSYEAAAAIAPHKRTLEDEALAFIRSRGRRGALDQEINAHLGTIGTGCPRRVGLVRRGAVVDSGERRRNPSGRRAVVWVAREYANAEVLGG